MPDTLARELSSDSEIAELLARVQTVAVLGIKPAEAGAGAAAHYVPVYAQRVGLRIIPVPVYYPDATEMLGEPVYRRISDIPERVDLVNVFRRPSDIPQHVEDILAANPRAVWFQLGIRNDDVAAELVRAGITVVQDRCLMVELKRVGR
jgi:predicted CoA-binding protein